MAEVRPPNWPLRAAILVVVLGVAGFGFWRTVRSARSAPYTVSSAARGPWRVVTAPATGPKDPVLLLEPPAAFTRELFDQLFKRSMESMRAPEDRGIPLVVAGELSRAGAAAPTLDALVAMAREAGLEATPPAPRCLGHLRAPEPDARQQAYVALFDAPAFATFRASLAARLGPAAGAPTPAMLLSTIESPSEQWLPLRVDPDKDCVAPIDFSP